MTPANQSYSVTEVDAMELTVLGKYGPYPVAGGATSGYLLKAGNTRLLLECGSGVLSRLLSHFSLDRLDAIVISHLHSDHIADLMILRYALQFIKMPPLKIFLPNRPYAEYDMLKGSGVFELIPVTDGLRAKLGDVELEFWEMTHPVPSFGVRVTCDGRTLAYSGDTNLNQRLPHFFNGADTALVDAGLLSYEKTGPAATHLTAREIGELFAKTPCKQVLLTHINPRVTDEQVEGEARQGCPVARVVMEGETYKI
jgi:ribonuclease BN (tRNA processing enzyme)